MPARGDLAYICVNPKGVAAHLICELIDPPRASSASTRSGAVGSVEVDNDPTHAHTEIDAYSIGRHSHVDQRSMPLLLLHRPCVGRWAMSGQDVILSGNPGATNSQVVYPRGNQPTLKEVHVVPNPHKSGRSGISCLVKRIRPALVRS